MSFSRRLSCTALALQSSARSFARSFPYLSARWGAGFSSSPHASRRWSMVRVGGLRHKQITTHGFMFIAFVFTSYSMQSRVTKRTVRIGKHVCCRYVDNGLRSHSLVLLYNPLVLSRFVTEVVWLAYSFARYWISRSSFSITSSRSFLRLNDLVDVAQFRIEARQHRTLYLLCFGVLRLSSSYRSVLCPKSTVR